MKKRSLKKKRISKIKQSNHTTRIKHLLNFLGDKMRSLNENELQMAHGGNTVDECMDGFQSDNIAEQFFGALIGAPACAIAAGTDDVARALTFVLAAGITGATIGIYAGSGLLPKIGLGLAGLAIGGFAGTIIGEKMYLSW